MNGGNALRDMSRTPTADLLHEAYHMQTSLIRRITFVFDEYTCMI